MLDVLFERISFEDCRRRSRNFIKGRLDEKLPSYEVLKMRKNSVK